MSSHATTMHAHSPGSYSISLVIHGVLVLAIVLSAYVLKDADKTTSNQIIELVAGEGDNYMAREAPALGSSEPTINYQPTAPTPPAQTAPEPTPVVESPITPVTPPETHTPPVTAPDALIVPPAKTKAKTPPKKTVEPPVKKMSKAEFDKLNASKTKNLPSQKASAPKPATPIKAPQIGALGKGLAGGVAGGTGSAPGAGGNALTAGERDMMDAYWALLALRIKEAHEQPEGLSSKLVVRIEYQVAANGTIGAVKIIRSSGNRAYDDSVLKAIRAVRGIGDRPDGRSGAKVADFRMTEEE